MKGIAHSQQLRDDVAWNLAEGYSLRRAALRNSLAISVVSEWNADPDFQRDIDECRNHLAKSLGDVTLARISAASNLVLEALNDELDLTDERTKARVALADSQLARSIDKLFNEPSVAVGFLRQGNQPSPAALPDGRRSDGAGASA